MAGTRTRLRVDARCFCTWRAPGRAQLGEQACRDLGRTLAALHKLPATGFGPAVRLDHGRLVGNERSPVAGLLARFSHPLPPDRKALAANPAVQAIPDLRDPLWPLILRVREAVADQSRLSATPIFMSANSSFTGTAFRHCWISATSSSPTRAGISDLYFKFHGPKVLAETLHGYINDKHQKKNLATDARLFSLGIALHHAFTLKVSCKAHRLPVAISHLKHILTDPMVAGRTASSSSRDWHVVKDQWLEGKPVKTSH